MRRPTLADPCCCSNPPPARPSGPPCRVARADELAIAKPSASRPRSCSRRRTAPAREDRHQRGGEPAVKHPGQQQGRRAGALRGWLHRIMKSSDAYSRPSTVVVNSFNACPDGSAAGEGTRRSRSQMTSAKRVGSSPRPASGHAPMAAACTRGRIRGVGGGPEGVRATISRKGERHERDRQN